MPLSASYKLTEQFYRWELRGRGWYYADAPVRLEPFFEPFHGHYVAESDIIDDGKRPTWLSSLFSGDNKPPAAIKAPDNVAYEDVDDDSVSIFDLTIPSRRLSGGTAMEQLLTMLSYHCSPVSLELTATVDELHFQVTCREHLAYQLVTLVRTYVPDIGIQEASIDRLLKLLDTESCIYTVDFGLAEECMRPIACYVPTTEPLTPLFGLLERLRPGESVGMQVLFCGTHQPWADSLLTAATDNSGKGSFFLDDPGMPSLTQNKVSRPLCAATMRLVTLADSLEEAGELLRHATTALVHASTSPHNALMPLSDIEYTIDNRVADLLLRTSHRVGMLVNTLELATLVHLPTMPLAKLKAATATKQAPAITRGHAYVLGMNEHLGAQTPVSLGTSERSRHVHLLGATGSGKSTLLYNLIMQDITLGNGLMVLDPHGDLMSAVLRAIPENRIDDVVLIDPSDRDYTVPFNILHAHSEQEKELLASDLVALFKRFSTSWGDQLHSVFSNAVLAFLYNTKPGTLADLRRFLIEPEYRANVLRTVTDPDIVYYWHKEYPLLKTNSIGSILTRLDGFLRPRVIRAMVSQPDCLDLAACMDDRKIVLVKLSQGILGAENSYLLGALLVAKLQQLAMSRQSVEQDARTPFYCYADEFHHFITPSMTSILSDTRKYGIGLVLAHQNLAQVQQVDEELFSSLLSNAGTRICFRLGDTDAKRLQDGFAAFSAEDLESLPVGRAIARVLTRDNDFNLAVQPFEPTAIDQTERVVSSSRQRYAVSTAQPAQQQSEVATDPPIQLREQPPIEPVAVAQRETREHRYLQTFIKKLAEEYGYVAKLEVPTPDGAGLVDVLLEKERQTIAIEISVTTTATWELHNIQKCLMAGYSRVIVCTDDPAKRKQLQNKLVPLSTGEQEKVAVITSADIPALFAHESRPEPGEAVLKGYRVKVNYGNSASQHNLLQTILKNK